MISPMREQQPGGADEQVVRRQRPVEGSAERADQAPTRGGELAAA